MSPLTVVLYCLVGLHTFYYNSRYKPLIVVSALMGVLIFVLFLWTTTLNALQATEIFYGTYMATEVAYYTYIYAKVDREHFQVVTGYTKSAILAGRFLAGVVAQLMVSFRVMDLRELNYLSLGCKYILIFPHLKLCNV